MHTVTVGFICVLTYLLLSKYVYRTLNTVTVGVYACLPTNCWADMCTGPDPSINRNITGTSWPKLTSKSHWNSITENSNNKYINRRHAWELKCLQSNDWAPLTRVKIYFIFLSEAPFYYLFSISWYQEFDFKKYLINSKTAPQNIFLDTCIKSNMYQNKEIKFFISGHGYHFFLTIVTQAWNVGQGHKLPRGICRSCQDEQLVQVWWM